MLSFDESPKIKIHLATIGPYSNGRMEDFRKATELLKDRKVASGVELYLFPATKSIFDQCCQEGLIEILLKSGVKVLGSDEKMILSNKYMESYTLLTTESRSKMHFGGVREIYHASVEVVIASAITGYIAPVDKIPKTLPRLLNIPKVKKMENPKKDSLKIQKNPNTIDGTAILMLWDNIDCAIFQPENFSNYLQKNRLSIYFTDKPENKSENKILIAGHNFGIGIVTQVELDNMKQAGIQTILAKSFTNHFERLSISSKFQLLACNSIQDLESKTGDILEINRLTGKIINSTNRYTIICDKIFSYSDESQNLRRNV